MFGNLFHSGFSKFANFFSLEPFEATQSEITANRKINEFLSETQPLGVYNADKNLNLGNISATYDQGNETGVPTVTPYNAPVNTQNVNTGDLFKTKEAECVTANRGTTFERLSYLTGRESNTNTFRCGWMYDVENPEGGVGAYGNRAGPVIPREENDSKIWHWNLADAKQKFHTNLCSEVKDCGDLDADRYKDKCGYCKTSQMAVPISGGVAAYDYPAGLGCATSQLVLRANNCPRPEPTPNPSAFQNSQIPSVNVGRALNACDPFENGRLPAACLISKASQVGCSENGSLITSLKSGTSSNYFESLQHVPAYKEYQRRTDNSISEAALKQGDATLNVILSQFGAIKSNTGSSKPGLKASALDLCSEKGSFERFDFCTEIKDTDYTPSVSLDCIQREFLRGGGQRTGKLYPEQENISYWRQFTPWINLKAEIKNLKARSMARTEGFTSGPITSTDVARAVNDFQGLGATIVKPILGKEPGVEIFLFKGDDEIKAPNKGVFLGRMIRSSIPNLPDTDNKEDTAKLTNTAFMFITNVLGLPNSDNRYNIKYNGDAGFILTKNKPFEYIYNGGGAAIKDSELSSVSKTRLGGVGEMSTTQSAAGGSWIFNDSSPNIILGYSAGGTTYNLRFSPDTGLPPECGCYGRSESGLRLYNKDECNLMGGNHYPSGECIVKTGGSYSWTCRDIPSPCRNGWNPLPNTMCFLTQERGAPMISFNLEKHYKDYNSPYPFCDRRLGSHKMTWETYINLPTWVFREDSQDTNRFPLGLSYVSMVGGGMYPQFSFKRNSFETMVIIMRFTELPSTETTIGNFLTFWPSDWSCGSPGLFVESRIENGTLISRLAVGTGDGNILSTDNKSMSINNPQIRTGITYIVTLRMIRATAGDPLQITSMQVGAGVLSILQQNPSAFTESKEFRYSNPSQLDKSNLSNQFLVTSPRGCFYDLFSIQLFDYPVTRTQLQIIAKDDWSRLQGGIFS